MTHEDPTKIARLERHLAALLQYGTWIASTIIGVGLVWELTEDWLHGAGAKHPAAIFTVTLGIALLILLPVLRVAWMLVFYLRQKDYRFGAITLLILIVIAVSVLFGMSHARLGE